MNSKQSEVVAQAIQGTPEGELLLQALLDAWFGQEVKGEAISVAGRLSGYS